MGGIVAYGTYVPYFRLKRSAIPAVLGTGGGRGTRSVASFDEDTTTMGVEAARNALRNSPSGTRPTTVFFSTPNPSYLDKTNATAIHAALDLDANAGAYDINGSVRSIVPAMTLGMHGGNALVVVADLRTGLPGGGEEAAAGDAAAAFVFSDSGPALVDVLGGGSASGEFIDRWRIPGEGYSRVWEERFGEFAYLPLAEEAINAAYKSANITGADVDYLVVSGLHSRACKGIPKLAGVKPEAVVDDLSGVIGNTGAVQGLLMFAGVLDTAPAGKTIVLVQLADGVDVLIARTTDALVEYRKSAKGSLAQQIGVGSDSLAYATFLTWRGMLDREPPRRPDPDRTAAPASYRSEDFKFAFVGSRCTACGTRHLPPARVCVNCRAVDQMERERLAEVPGKVATYTVDRLAFSLSPPVVAGAIDFDGGGRFLCEFADSDPANVKIGDRMEMTFRRLMSVEGIHNYFWKARPVRS